jgi:dihydroorotase
MHEGEWSSRLGLPGQPAEAEELMVMRDIALSRLTGGRVHLQHLSTARSLEMVRAAKADGLKVTAEVTPHHLSLTDAACADYDTVFKVHPPLRTQSDLDALRLGIADGSIDAIATDHAPHTPDRKDMPFDQAPPGMLGLETALGVVLSYTDMEMETVLERMSWRPAWIAGIEPRHGGTLAIGRPGNICVIDPTAEWTVERDAVQSRSRNTPFHGDRLTGRVRHTLVDGVVVCRDGEVQQ